MAAVAGVSTPIRVLIVDDDALVRAALTMMLAGTDDIRVVAEAADGAEVASAVDAYQPDVVLMDIRMPRMDGLAATELLRARDDAPAGDRADHLRRRRPRAARAARRRERLPAQGHAAAGDPQGGPARRRRRGDAVAGGDAPAARARRRRRRGRAPQPTSGELLERLTDREREVAVAIGQGKSNAEIATELYMSVATVKAHVSRLLTKLELNNRVQIALLAHDAGLA